LKAVGVSCLSLELLALYSFQRFTDKWAAFLWLLFVDFISFDYGLIFTNNAQLYFLWYAIR
jgi:hypothetical protein